MREDLTMRVAAGSWKSVLARGQSSQAEIREGEAGLAGGGASGEDEMGTGMELEG